MASSAPIIISRVPASKQQGRRGGRPAAQRRPPPPGAHMHKEFGWVGVRPRTWGGFAAEIRIPSSRSRVWIGKFQCALQAALAYDAAMFCFYGEDLPKMRKFNFPAVPRPFVPADARRAGLTVATVKAIAEKHARTFGAGFVTPQMLFPAAPAPLAPPLPVVVPGATAAGAQVAVAAAAAAGAAGVAVAGDVAAGAGPSATVDGNAGNKEIVYIDAELMSNEDLEFSCNPEDLARVMGVDLVDLIFGDDI